MTKTAMASILIGAIVTINMSSNLGSNNMKTLSFSSFIVCTFCVAITLILTQCGSPKIRPDNSKLAVGTAADFPPFAFFEDDKMVGFEIDIVNEVAKRLGKEIEIENRPFDILLTELQSGRLQVVAAGLTATEERAKRVNFTKPYLKGEPFVVMTLKKHPAITDMKDLNGKSVIVNDGYTADMYMSEIKGPLLTRRQAPAEAILALKNGHAFAFVTALNTVKPFLDQFGRDEFNLFKIPDTEENCALAISKKHPELLPEVQKVLNAMIKDKTIEQLKKKWKIV